jgi:hypothetical protein
MLTSHVKKNRQDSLVKRFLQDGANLFKKRPYDGKTDTHMKTPNLGNSAQLNMTSHRASLVANFSI